MKPDGLVMGLLFAGAMVSGCATVKDTVSDLTGSGPGISALDTNGDGVLSEDEAEQSPGLASAFEQIDTNGDRNINPTELKAAYTGVAEVDFDALDFNDDGVLSEREAQQARPSLTEVFSRVDADGDGNVSKTEYEAARLNLLEETEFAAFDTDGDGVIDQQEAEKDMRLSEDFDTIDIDGDDLIGDQEFERARQD